MNRTLHGRLGIRILSSSRAESISQIPSALEDKIRIPARPCNILYLYFSWQNSWFSDKKHVSFLGVKKRNRTRVKRRESPRKDGENFLFKRTLSQKENMLSCLSCSREHASQHKSDLLWRGLVAQIFNFCCKCSRLMFSLIQSNSL